MAAEPKSPGPECAVLTSIGTVYLYRLTPADLRAFRELPATRLAIDKFRVLLTRIASLHVSDKGILDAGPLTADQVESLADDEVERIAESYLDGTTVRWYRHEGASATISVIRNSNEPATKFLDRLLHWYAMRGPGRASGEGEARAATTGQFPRPRMVPPDTLVLTRREAWIALGALALLAILGIGAFLQHYLLVHALQRQQDALIAQVKETNAMLASNAAQASQENARLRQRLDALDSMLRARSAVAAERTREAKAPAKPAASKTRAHR
jgi:hypothetical protein